MAKELHSVEEVISELGGFAAVKELTGSKSHFTVRMWKSRKRFPPTTFVLLQSALEDRDLRAPKGLWGMS